MAKEIDITIRIPEKGDELPFIVLDYKGHEVAYNEAGELWVNNYEQCPTLAAILGIPETIEISARVN